MDPASSMQTSIADPVFADPVSETPRKSGGGGFHCWMVKSQEKKFKKTSLSSWGYERGDATKFVNKYFLQTAERLKKSKRQREREREREIERDIYIYAVKLVTGPRLGHFNG